MTTLRVLVIEDNPADAELMFYELRQGGFELDYKVVVTEMEFLSYLDSTWDVILSDYSLPQWTGVRALQLLNESGLDIPFVLVSGVVDEDVAVQCMKNGADDYIHKDRMARLGVAVTKALEDKYQRSEIKKAQEALRESEFRHRTMVANLSSGIIVYRPSDDGDDYLFESVNSAGEQISQVREHEIVGKSILEVFPAVKNFGLWDALNQVNKTGEPQHLDAARYQDSRLSHWAENYIYKLPTGEIVCVYKDVTEKKRIEATLAKRESSLRQAQAIAHLGSWETNLETGASVWSDEFFRICGLEPGSIEALVEGGLTIIHPDDREQAAAVLEKAKRQGQPYDVEKRIVRPNGEMRWVQSRGEVVDNQAGEKKLVGTFLDITERKQAELALRESEQQFRALFDRTNDAVCIFSLDQHLIKANQQALNVFGYDTFEEVVGRPIRDFIAPVAREENKRHYAALLAGELLPVYESVMLRKDGTEFPAEINIAVAYDTTGNPSHIQSVIRDITERNKVEQQLRKSEISLNKAQHVAHIGRWEWYIKTNTLEWSDEMYNIFGIEPEGFSGSLADVIEKAIHPDDLAIVEASNLSVIREKAPIPVEYRIIRPDGVVRTVWAEAGELVTDEEGHPSVLSGIVQDITERKQAENALAQERNMLRTLIDNVPDYIFVKDRQGQFTVSNIAHAKAVQLTPDELIGKTALELFPPEVAKKFHDDDQRVMVDNKPMFNQERMTVNSDGVTTWVLTTKVPIHDESGAVTGLVGISRDITERTQAQQKLAKYVERLNILHTIDGAILASESTEEIAQVVLEHIRRIAHPYRVSIVAFDFENRQAQILATYSRNNANLVSGVRIPLSAIFDVETLQRGETVTIEDVLTWDRSPTVQDLVITGIRSMVTVPLMFGGTVIGMIGLGHDKPGNPFAEFMEVIHEIGIQLAVAIRQSQLHESEIQRRHEAETLQELATALVSTQDIRQLLELILDRLQSFAPYDSASIFWLNESNLEILACRGFSQPDDIIGILVPNDNLLFQEISQTKQSMRLDDVHTDDRFANWDRSNEHIRGWLGVPLIVNGEVRGYLTLDSHRVGAYEKTQAVLVESFVAHAAIAIENAQLIETVRRHAEELEERVAERTAQLQRYSERIQAILNSDSDSIILTDSQGSIQQANPAFYAMFSYAIDEAVGKPLSTLVQPDKILILNTALDEIIKGNPPIRVEITVCRKDGTLFDADLALSGVTLNHKNIGAVCSIRDITERKRIQRDMEEAKFAAVSANHAKSQFLANMSHEIRTPLNAIIGFAQLMDRDAGLMLKQRESIRIIRRSGQHLLELINDVLEFSKIEVAQATLRLSNFDLQTMLRNLEEMFQYRTGTRGLTLNFQKNANLPRIICGDERKLRQIILNFLSNALKFTETGSITLTADYRESQLIVEVTDTGAGIAVEELESIFEPFKQAESGQKRQEGTGLGLAISQRFAQMMGGNITVKSQLGEGATFNFTVPIQLADTADDTNDDHPEQRVLALEGDQPRYRLLVVEDHLESRLLLRSLLEQVGFEVRTAENGREAVEIHEEWKPHLIWMDMRMPEMDGYEATQQIKATSQGQDTIVIALTASAFEEERAKILDAGCDDYVRKPFDEGEVFAKVAKHLGTRYVYEGALQAKNPDSSQVDAPLSVTDRAGLPADWLAALHEASTRGDRKKALTLVEQIRSSHLKLAERLTTLILEFRFDKLVALTKKDILNE